MSEVTPDIKAVESGDELLAAWKEYGFEAAGGNSAWAEAVETENHDILVARLGMIAVGFVDIKWNGPVAREKVFTDTLAESFPGQSPVPVAYLLNVHPYYRKMRIGWNLMDTAERLVAHSKTALPLIALSVKVSNNKAISLYQARDYKTLTHNGEKEIEMDYPDLNDKGEWVKGSDKVYIMAKDLSGLRTD